MRDKPMIETPLGPRERMSRGEVTVPTYYGLLKRGDKAQLKRMGNYRQRDIDLATGIDERGQLNIWLVGDYYTTAGPYR